MITLMGWTPASVCALLPAPTCAVRDTDKATRRLVCSDHSGMYLLPLPKSANRVEYLFSLSVQSIRIAESDVADVLHGDCGLVAAVQSSPRDRKQL